ncbi:MAG: recombinase family protein [Pseudohongiellaceae bacterium]|nr:recombinase family protein [Pseudohongiellaceae bacterium]
MAIFQYYRTSSFEYEALSGVELANAEDELKKALEGENSAILQFCDSLSGADPVAYADVNTPWQQVFLQRPHAKALISSMAAGDSLVVYSLSRIFSSSQDVASTIAYFRSNGLALYVVELSGEVSSPEFTLDFLHAASLLGEIEKRRSAERIRNVKHQQRKKGRYLGGSRPFGYMIHSNGKLIENPMEQKILRRIIQLREQGMSLRAIAQEVSTPLTPVSFKTVQRILQRHV